MKLVDTRGLTGRVRFDQFGIRTDFTLDIVELHRSGLEKVRCSRRLSSDLLIKVGTWHDSFGIEFDRLATLKTSDPKDTIENKTIVVSTIKVFKNHKLIILIK